MTDYSDVEKANTLVLEQSRIASGVAMLDANGTIASFTVAPPPVTATPVSPPSQPMPMATIMPVSIQTVDPSPELVAAARAAMVQRHNAISAELETLGVTGAPPMSR